MSATVWFTSDCHLGHKRAVEFAGRPDDNHDQWIMDNWADKVKGKDIVYVLGDIAFTTEGLNLAKSLPGQKRLLLGNHDQKSLHNYTDVFGIIPGLWRYKEFWLSHGPLHPVELRNRVNIHGHVHHNTVDDPWYFNACVDVHGGSPVSLEEIRFEMKMRNY